MIKSATIEHTFSKEEIEQILWEHLCKKLMKEDVDFKQAKLIQNDFTYFFDDKKPAIHAVAIMGDLKMRKP